MESSENLQPDLTASLTDAVARHTNADNIRDLVEKNISEIVKRSVDSALRNYGEVGRQIEKQISTALMIPADLDLPAYGHMVMQVLRTNMNNILHELIEKKLDAEMKEMLSIAAKEIKLSEVVEKMVEHIRDSEPERHGSRITCEVEDSGSGSTWVYLHEEGIERGGAGYSFSTRPKTKYDCDVRMLVSESGKIYSITIDKVEAKGSARMGYLEDWKKMVFSAYCCGSKFIIDEDSVSTELDFS